MKSLIWWNVAAAAGFVALGALTAVWYYLLVSDPLIAHPPPELLQSASALENPDTLRRILVLRIQQDMQMAEEWNGLLRSAVNLSIAYALGIALFLVCNVYELRKRFTRALGSANDGA